MGVVVPGMIWPGGEYLNTSRQLPDMAGVKLPGWLKPAHLPSSATGVLVPEQVLELREELTVRSLESVSREQRFDAGWIVERVPLLVPIVVSRVEDGASAHAVREQQVEAEGLR